MKAIVNYILSCFFILAYGFCTAQTPKSSGEPSRTIDSLRSVLTKTIEDTVRVKTLNALSSRLRKDGQTDSALKIALLAKELAYKLNSKKMLALSKVLIGKCFVAKGKYPSALSNYFAALKIYAERYDTEEIANLCDNIATVLNRQGNYKEALRYFSISLHLSKIIDDREGIATSLNNIGSVYQSMGNYPESLLNNFAALRMKESMGDKLGIAMSFVNLGTVYYGQGNYKEAQDKFFSALKISQELGEKYGVGLCYNNIGATYTDLGNYKEALKYHYYSLKMKIEVNDKEGIPYSYVNIGLAYANLKNYPEALINYSNALKLQEAVGDKEGIALTCNNTGLVYLQMGKTNECRKYLQRGLKLGIETGSQSDVKSSYEHLTALDSVTGNYKSSLEYYKLFIAYRDSLNNEENTKKTVHAQMNYEFDKKEAATKLKQEKKEAVSVAESRKQKVIIWSVSGILLLVFCFAVFAYRSYLQKQKSNIEITKQKHLIEEKQKEILDSIYYARRIQRSLLPNEKYIARVLSQSRTKPHD